MQFHKIIYTYNALSQIIYGFKSQGMIPIKKRRKEESVSRFFQRFISGVRRKITLSIQKDAF